MILRVYREYFLPSLIKLAVRLRNQNSKPLNKRSVGHIAHIRSQLKSMGTFESSYGYIYYKIVPVLQEEKIFKFNKCTYYLLV